MSNVVTIITSAVLVLAFTAPSMAGKTGNIVIHDNKGTLVNGSPDEMLKDFAFLISKVRGAVRYHLEKDKECFPWVSLAIDPHDREAIGEFRFTPEMVAKVGDVSAKTFGKIFALIANIESYTLGAIGTCETDSSIKETKIPNVIALHLERRNGPAITIRFPFEQKGNGHVSYIKNKVAISNATPLLFVPPNR